MLVRPMQAPPAARRRATAGQSAAAGAASASTTEPAARGLARDVEQVLDRDGEARQRQAADVGLGGLAAGRVEHRAQEDLVAGRRLGDLDRPFDLGLGRARAGGEARARGGQGLEHGEDKKREKGVACYNRWALRLDQPGTKKAVAAQRIRRTQSIPTSCGSRLSGNPATEAFANPVHSRCLASCLQSQCWRDLGLDFRPNLCGEKSSCPSPCAKCWKPVSISVTKPASGTPRWPRSSSAIATRSTSSTWKSRFRCSRKRPSSCSSWPPTAAPS